MFDDVRDYNRFDKILSDVGGVEKNKNLFDFRDPDIKRKEFNKIRNQVFNDMLRDFGHVCMLKIDGKCEGNSAVVDHLIPLSSNVLNKDIRGMRARNGKKAPTQSLGSNDMLNFVLSCRRCNAFKMNKLPTRGQVSMIFKYKQVSRP